LYSQFTRVELPSERLDAFKHDGEAKFQAREVGVEIIFRNARGGAVLLPDLRNRQARDVFDPSASNNRANGA
jgi:hypothetical protein